MAVIFLFIDGVGLGNEEDSNPFYRKNYSAFTSMSGGQPFTATARGIEKADHIFKGVDATLGVEGLPQSGTGQTTLFTGKNAAREIGKHFGPFPHSGIKPLLKKHSIFHKLKERGKTGRFMNAYPDLFFEKAERRDRWSCTTLMARSAGIPLHTQEDVINGKAITAEITQEIWRKRLDIEVPEIEVEEASKRVLDMATETDLVLYEYYLTDKAGHKQSHSKAEEVLTKFDAFLGYLIENKRDVDTLVLSSDHGNIEDLSVKTHTLNKVPLYIHGPGAKAFVDAGSIQDVTPGILRALG